jgi:hypothetical protein
VPGIAQLYSAGQQAGCSGVPVPAGAGNFSPYHRVQTGSGPHPASYPMGTRGSFPGVKRPGREADHSPPSSAEVKNVWSYISTSQCAFMAWCSVKHRDTLPYFTSPNLTLYICVSRLLYVQIHGPQIESRVGSVQSLKVRVSVQCLYPTVFKFKQNKPDQFISLVK